MSRHNPEPAMGLPWRIDLCPDRLGGGYLIKGSTDDKVRIYGTRADVDFIINAVNSLEDLKGKAEGYDLAIKMLQEYKPENEEVTCCMHSPEWAAWLEKKKASVFNTETSKGE